MRGSDKRRGELFFHANREDRVGRDHRIEGAFGWMKVIAVMRKTKLRRLPKVAWAFTFAVAAYNLIRLPKLLVAPA